MIPQRDSMCYIKSPEFKLFVKKGAGSNIPSEKFFESSSENNKDFKPGWDLSSKIPTKYKYILVSFSLLVLFALLVWFFFVAIKKIRAYKKTSIKKQLNQKLLHINKLLNQKNWQKASVSMIQTGIYVLSCAQMQTVSPNWRQSLKALPPSIHKKYAKAFEQLFLELESLSFSKHSKQQALSRTKQAFKILKTLSKSFLKKGGL